MPSPNEREKEQQKLLEHVELMVRYWAGMDGSNVPADAPKLYALDGLAFSLLVMLDGGADVGPYAVIPLDENGEMRRDPGDASWIDVAGELHELQKEVADRMRVEREEPKVRPDGPETAEGGLIGQQPY